MVYSYISSCRTEGDPYGNLVTHQRTERFLIFFVPKALKKVTDTALNFTGVWVL